MANRSLGALTIDLILKAGGFEVGMDKSARAARTTSGKIQKELNAAAKTAAAFAIAGVTAGAALIKSSIDIADQTAKTADKLGLTTEELSKLRYSAEQTGVSQNTFDMALQRMTRRLSEAKNGLGEAKGAINELGLDAKQLADSGPDEAFKTIAQSISEIPDQATRVRLAFKFFDSEGVALVNTMALGRDGIEAMGDELERLGGVIDTDTAKQSEEFNDNLERMQKVVMGTGQQIAQDLLPQMIEFTDLIKDPETQESIRLVVQGIADMAINAASAARELVQFSKWLGEAFAAAAHGPAWDDIPRLLEQIETLEQRRTRVRGVNAAAQRAELDDQIRQLREQIDLVNSLRRPAAVETEPPVAAPAAPAADVPEYNGALEDSIAKRIDKYREMIALTGEITELERVRYDLMHGELQGADEQSRLELESNAAQIDALKKKEEAIKSVTELRESTMDSEQRRLHELREQYQQLAELIALGPEGGGISQQEGSAIAAALADAYEAADPLLQQYNQLEESLFRQVAMHKLVTETERIGFEVAFGNLALLDEAQQKHLLALAAELDALEAADEAEKERTERIKAQMETIEEFGKEAARNMQTAFADFLFDPFDGGLKGMVKSFGQTVRRIAAEAASSAILKSIFGGLSGSNNAFLAAFGGMFDTGGYLPAGKWGIAGERGPEIVKGPAVITGREETARMMGGGGSQINIINNAPVQVTPGPVRMEDGRRTQDIVIESLRGALADGSLDDELGRNFGLSRSRGQG